MKECSLFLYRSFNDRNSTHSVIEDVIEIDADSIVPGEPLPGWRFGGDPPAVEYYDGENIEISRNGRRFNARVGGDLVEIWSARCEDNIQVEEREIVEISLSAVTASDRHPSWVEMAAHGSFSAIVLNALPAADSDPGAARHFLRILSMSANLFLLTPAAVGLIKEYAEKDNMYALFALGRYHLATRIDEDSLDKAKACLRKAHALGLPEATAALAQMYAYGDFGLVDRTKSRALLAKALDKNCDYAAELHLRNIIFGLHGHESNPGKAIEITGKLISEDIKRFGKGGENPMWYYWRACAKGFRAGEDDFRKAAEAGVLPAFSDMAIACSHNDQGELTDRDAYIKALEYGKSRGDIMCVYLYAMSRVDSYDDMPGYKKELESARLIANLEYAFSLGSNFAAETLGDIYYHGLYGIGEDNSQAWQWYAQGALLYNADCYEKMFDMIRDHYVDKDEDFKDMIALEGARLGSDKLVNETVIAYTYGRLTGFAAEIEQYYVPLFDNAEENDDDDGRFDAYV